MSGSCQWPLSRWNESGNVPIKLGYDMRSVYDYRVVLAESCKGRNKRLDVCKGDFVGGGEIEMMLADSTCHAASCKLINKQDQQCITINVLNGVS